MKKLALCLGILFTVVANAALTTRVPLAGQHAVASSAGRSSLICEYQGNRARFEILAQHASCAPFIDVE